MRLSSHQCQFLCGLRLIEKYIPSDLFCHLNNVQMERHSFVNRNSIKGPNGPITLTVPCKNMKHYQDMKINEVEIDNSTNWQKRHLKSIQSSYKKAPYYDEIMPWIESIYELEHHSLDLLCRVSFEAIMNALLGADRWKDRQMDVLASDYNFKGEKSDLVLSMCNKLGADEFTFGKFGKDYADTEKFEKAGIKVRFQEYIPHEYPQLHGDFIPDMSVVDLLFNVDPDKRVRTIMEGGRY